MSDNKFLVKFRNSVQVTQHEWELQWTEKLFDDKSTLAEVKEWVRIQMGHPTPAGEFRLFDVNLSEPQQK